MSAFLSIVGGLGLIIFAVWLLANLIKRKEKRKSLIGLGISIVLLIIAGIISPAPAPDGNGAVADPPAVEQPTPETPEPTPEPDQARITAGTYMVSDDILPGRYRTEGGVIYWERLKGLSGELKDIIANGAMQAGSIIVDINPTDVAFKTDGPGYWVLIDEEYKPQMKTTFTDGYYIVGVDIEPGRYKSVEGCTYWARLKGFSGELGDIIANGAMLEGTVYVEISASDIGFQTQGAEWVKIN